MSVKSEAEAMQELASLLWSRYIREQTRSELNHNMNAYKAQVVTNNGDGTLTVKRPFESVNLTLKAAPSLAYAQAGDMVLVVGIGDKSKALSNAFILCKADLSDNSTVPVYGFGDQILENWYFVGGGGGVGVFPVNQRGQTSYSGAVYGIDRWTGGSAYGSIQVDSTGLIVSGTTNNYGLSQLVENGTSLLNRQTVTISALLTTGKLITGTGTINLLSSDVNFIAVSDDDANPNGSIILQGSSSRVRFIILAQPGKSIGVVAVKLELGARQTLAHIKNGTWVLNKIPSYGEELAKCQRYLYMLPAYQGIRTMSVGANDMYFSLSIPQEMVKTPIIVNDSYLSVRSLGGTTTSGFTFSVAAVAAKGPFVRIRATKTSHGLSDGTLFFGSTSPGAFLSAE